MEMHKTGKIIMQRRKELQMTQKDIADKLNVSIAAVSKWERGLNYPDLSIMEPLAKVLCITVTELLQLENKTSEQIVQNITEISINENKTNSKIIITKMIAFLLSAILIAIVYLCITNNDIFRILFFEKIGTGMLNLATVILGIVSLCYGIAAISTKTNKYKKYALLSLLCCAVALHIPIFIGYLILRFEYTSTLQDIIGGYYFGSAVLLISIIIINVCAVLIHKK